MYTCCADPKSILQAQKDISEIKEDAVFLNHTVHMMQMETDKKFEQIFLAIGVDPGPVTSAVDESCNINKEITAAAGVVDRSAKM